MTKAKTQQPEPPNDKKIKCDHCSTTFTREKHCKRHMRNNVCKWQEEEDAEMEAKTFRYYCQICCDYGCMLRSDLIKHQTSPTGESNWCKRKKYVKIPPAIPTLSTPQVADVTDTTPNFPIPMDIELEIGSTYEVGNVLVDAPTESGPDNVEEVQLNQTVWRPPAFTNPQTHSCYMNSVLQCLFHNDEFIRWIMSYYRAHESVCGQDCKFFFLSFPPILYVFI